VRVNDVTDFTNLTTEFMSPGVGCETCHGRLDQMPLTWKEHALFMEMVPGLPPGAGKICAAQGGSVHHGLGASEDQLTLGRRLVENMILGRSISWMIAVSVTINRSFVVMTSVVPLHQATAEVITTKEGQGSS
jgi:hypothetical protein